MSKYFPSFCFLGSALSCCCCWQVFPQIKGIPSVLPHIASATHKKRHTHRTMNQNIVIAHRLETLHRLEIIFKSHVIQVAPPCRLQRDVHA